MKAVNIWILLTLSAMAPAKNIGSGSIASHKAAMSWNTVPRLTINNPNSKLLRLFARDPSGNESSDDEAGPSSQAYNKLASNSLLPHSSPGSSPRPPPGSPPRVSILPGAANPSGPPATSHNSQNAAGGTNFWKQIHDHMHNQIRTEVPKASATYRKAQKYEDLDSGSAAALEGVNHHLDKMRASNDAAQTARIPAMEKTGRKFKSRLHLNRALQTHYTHEAARQARRVHKLGTGLEKLKKIAKLSKARSPS